jgi:hypothetical protein
LFTRAPVTSSLPPFRAFPTRGHHFSPLFLDIAIEVAGHWFLSYEAWKIPEEAVQFLFPPEMHFLWLHIHDQCFSWAVWYQCMQQMEVGPSRFCNIWECHLTRLWQNFARRKNTIHDVKQQTNKQGMGMDLHREKTTLASCMAAPTQNRTAFNLLRSCAKFIMKYNLGHHLFIELWNYLIFLEM